MRTKKREEKTQRRVYGGSGAKRLCLDGLVLLLLLDLEQQCAVDVRQDTTVGNRGADQGVELLVTTDGELKMSGGDTLDLEVLGGIL